MFWTIFIIISIFVIVYHIIKHYFKKRSLKYLVNKINWDNVQYLSDDDIVKVPFDPRVYEEKYDIIYIGSGMSALVGACLAAVHGKKVLVLEQNDQIGGMTHNWIEDDKYEFSSGCHFIPKSNMLEKLLNILTNGRITFKNCTNLGDDEISVKIYENSDDPHILDIPYVVPSGEGKEEETMKQFIKEYYEKYGEYEELYPINEILSQTNNFWNDGRKVERELIIISLVRRYIPICLRSFVIFILELFGIKIFKWAKMTMYEYMWKVFPYDDHLSSILRSICVRYTQGDPNKVTADVILGCMGIIANKRRTYPNGGSKIFGLELTKTIRACKGQAYCSAPVTEIVLDKNDIAIGVKVGKNDRIIYANTIVSCCGIANTFNKLLPEYVKPDNFDIYSQPSTHDMGITLGYDCSHRKLGINELLVWIISSRALEDLSQSYQDTHSSKYSKIPPSIGIYHGSLVHKKLEGTTTLEVWTSSKQERFTRWNNTIVKTRGSEYLDEKEEALGATEDLIYFMYPKLEENVDHHAYFTPLSIKHWCGSYSGEIYGVINDANRKFKMFDACIRSPGKVKGGLIISGVDSVIAACVELAALSGIFSALQITKNLTLIGILLE